MTKTLVSKFAPAVGERESSPKQMNNIKLKILNHVNTNPWLTRGGLVDAIGGRARTEQDIRYLVEKGYLVDRDGMELTDRGFACINSGSFRNRAKRLGQGALGLLVSVIAVVIGNWLWGLIQSVL